MQEKITRGRYGDALNEDGTRGEKFNFSLALVAVQCIFNYMFAKGIIKTDCLFVPLNSTTIDNSVFVYWRGWNS